MVVDAGSWIATALPTSDWEHRNVSVYFDASEKMSAGESTLKSGTCNHTSPTDSPDKHTCTGHADIPATQASTSIIPQGWQTAG